jgi:hypothetical protein
MTICVELIDERADVGADEVRQLSVADLADGCATATSRFRQLQSASDACAIELFRRAICERDELAWEAVYAQYHGMVRAWLCRHPAWPTIGDDLDDWVNGVFERFWAAITPDRFASFPSLAALLRYLKLCAHSVLLDEVRARHGRQLQPLSEEVVATGVGNAERTVLESATSGALWAAIDAEVKDEAERLVAYLGLALELKPQEIQARHPDQFASVAQVYTVKRNLLDRLRRNTAIRRFVS